VFEGEVVDSDALANELKTLWKEGGFASKRVQLGVANQKIVVRTMEFPQIDEKELRAAIEFQAQEHIPIPVDEAILDYKVLSTHVDDDGTIKQRILLVAAQREMVKQFVNVAKKAGLMIDGIDLQAFAMIRALAPRPSFIDQGAPEGSTGDVVALVNIGSGITNLVIAANGVTQFTRVINLGAEALTQSLMNHRSLPYEEADALRIQVGLAGDQPDQPGDLSLETQAEIHQLFDRACEPFFRRAAPVDRLLPHPGARGRDLKARAERRRRPDPQHRVQPVAGASSPRGDRQPAARSQRRTRRKLTEVQLEWMAPRLAIAIGLALDDEG